MMEIHHRLYEKAIHNYNTATVATANNLVLHDTDQETSGIPENSTFNATTSTSLIDDSDAFVTLNQATLDINEFSGYSNASTGLLNDSTRSDDSSLNIPSTIVTTSPETNDDLNFKPFHHRRHHHHHHHQQQQQQQQVGQILPLESSEKNICALVGTITTTTTTTTATTRTDQANTTMIIAARRIHSCDSNDCANNCNCVVTTDNEPNFSQQISKLEVQICSSCSQLILDRTLLNVNATFWHINCLKCSQCATLLEQYSTCFLKDNNFFCKQCYNRRFGTKCSSCQRLIHSTDWVRRARSFVYHLACFACDQCKRQLSTGEEFALQNCRLLCKQHYMEINEEECGQQKAKTKRVRTTFAEEQLAVLQTHFQIDSNPDGADLERIATMTGLSKRVTQVWFQNSRARQKKYQVSKKNRTNHTSNSGRSSIDLCSTPKSPSGDSIDGMVFPTSVLTSAEDAVVATELRTMPSGSP